MPDFLRTIVDKFTFLVATDRLYTSDGVWVVWVQPQGTSRVRVGVTDFMQQHHGDVAFASVKPPKTTLKAGDEFAEIETMKVTISLSSPVGGTIVEVNAALTLKPEIVNEDPYEKGWLAEIETANWEADRAKLLTPQAYMAVMQSQAEQELKS
jgi:glycine cleavage system H protein